MRCFAVFGDPIAHSISPRLHNLAIKKLGIEGFYGRVHLCECGVDALKNRFNALGLNGANITIPHKQTTAKIADKLDIFASATGAVNTLVRRGGGLLGFNTDAPGFMMAISDFKDIQNALIIGAGGTAKALAAALSMSGVSISVLNRSDKSSEFANCEFLSFDSAISVATSFDLVINTTPAGLINSDLPAPQNIMQKFLGGARYAFDAVYGIKTPFLAMADECGLKYKDGKEMLLNQAAIAFCHFFYDYDFRVENIAELMRPALSYD